MSCRLGRCCRISSKRCSISALRRRDSTASRDKQLSTTVAKASSQNDSAEGEGAVMTWWIGALWRAPPWLMMSELGSEALGRTAAQCNDVEPTKELR